MSEYESQEKWERENLLDDLLNDLLQDLKGEWLICYEVEYFDGTTEQCAKPISWSGSSRSLRRR